MEPKTTGVVLLHGKRFEPSEMMPMAEAFRAAGFLAETPEVPWSARRLYDRTPQEANEEIAATAARLRQAGAQRLVIGGHSSGGAGALRYAAVAHDVAALALIAPAPVVEGDNFHRRVASQLAQAQKNSSAPTNTSSASLPGAGKGVVWITLITWSAGKFTTDTLRETKFAT
jgi:predicted alpha/beta-hydrolase family hydrolase